jgi:hypothetical protein
MTKALIADSLPQIFYDPPTQQARRARSKKAKAGPALPPKAPPNPARMAAEQLARFSLLPGWQDFAHACAQLQGFTNTPGWEDNSSPPRKTVPNAKPIDLAQWGAAMATAGIIASNGDIELPKPGVDPLGFLWLYWDTGTTQFALELHSGMLQQTYKWRRVVDGQPREHAATSLDEVILAIRAFAVEARREAAP